MAGSSCGIFFVLIVPTLPKQRVVEDECCKYEPDSSASYCLTYYLPDETILRVYARSDIATGYPDAGYGFFCKLHNSSTIRALKLVMRFLKLYKTEIPEVPGCESVDSGCLLSSSATVNQNSLLCFENSIKESHLYPLKQLSEGMNCENEEDLQGILRRLVAIKRWKLLNCLIKLNSIYFDFIRWYYGPLSPGYFQAQKDYELQNFLPRDKTSNGEMKDLQLF